ncbi:unnamed protein product [Musa banksii]
MHRQMRPVGLNKETGGDNLPSQSRLLRLAVQFIPPLLDQCVVVSLIWRSAPGDRSLPVRTTMDDLGVELGFGKGTLKGTFGAATEDRAVYTCRCFDRSDALRFWILQLHRFLVTATLSLAVACSSAGVTVLFVKDIPNLHCNGFYHMFVTRQNFAANVLDPDICLTILLTTCSMMNQHNVTTNLYFYCHDIQLCFNILLRSCIKTTMFLTLPVAPRQPGWPCSSL